MEAERYSVLCRANISEFARCSEPNVIGEDCALRQWGAEREESRFDLMRLKVNLSIGERGSQLFHTVGGAPFRQFISEVFRRGQSDRAKALQIQRYQYRCQGRQHCP